MPPPLPLHQMYPWLTPSIIGELTALYDASSASTGKEFATLLSKDGQLAQALQRFGAREARQAAALRKLLRLQRELSLFYCEEELQQRTSRGDEGKMRGWVNNFYGKKARREAGWQGGRWAGRQGGGQAYCAHKTNCILPLMLPQLLLTLNACFFTLPVCRGVLS